MSPAEWSAVRLTAQLAALSTLLLLLIGTPIAWWLSRTRSALKPLAASLVAIALLTGFVLVAGVANGTFHRLQTTSLRTSQYPREYSASAPKDVCACEPPDAGSACVTSRSKNSPRAADVPRTSPAVGR